MLKDLLEKIQNLSFREKVLCLALSVLFGAFLGLKLPNFSENFLKNYLKEKIKTQDESLSQELSQNQQILLENEAKIASFKNKNELYLDALYKIATQNKISFKELKNESKSKDFLDIYSINLEFNAPFFEGLSFLKDIQQSAFELKITSLKINKNEDLSLNFKLVLSFARIKDM